MDGAGALNRVETKPAAWRRVIGLAAALALCALALYALHRELQPCHLHDLRHGEHFYNFQGLRKYKEKFDPQWRPRYLASPGGLALPQVLGDLSSLISGGFGGLVGK